MIKVLFFAKLREDLGVAKLEIDKNVGMETISDLINYLIQNNGDGFEERLLSPQIVVSQNHEVVDRNAIIKEGDEIAFYPPVTGG